VEITRLWVYTRNNSSRRHFRSRLLTSLFTFRSFSPRHMNIDTRIPEDSKKIHRVSASHERVWHCIKYYTRSALRLSSTCVRTYPIL
jgi:hypothetical protein